MSLVEAELAKIALNCFVTMKISFANQIYMIANDFGANPNKVLDVLGNDSRIGNKCLKPGLPFSGPCVMPHTLIQTTNGLEAIDTIEVGDHILSHDGRYHTVTKIHQRKYIGNLIKITGEGFPSDPIITTPEHPIWSGTRISNSKKRHYYTQGKSRLTSMTGLESLKFTPANSLNIGDVLALPQICEEKICPAVMNLYQDKLGRPSSAAGIHILDEEMFYTLGWYLAEGSTWQREIKLSVHSQEEKYINHIGNIWKKHLGVSTKINRRKGNGIASRTTCSSFARYLRETFGGHCYDKHVPSEWINLPLMQLKSLLRGMWYGDGSNSCGQFAWATTSLDLFNFMKLAFLRLRIPFTTRKVQSWVGKDGTKHREAYFVMVRNPKAYELMNEFLPDLKITAKTNGKQTVWFENNIMLYHIKKIEQFNYNGDVFNLEVDKAESYVLEGGTVHNCFPRDNSMLSSVAKFAPLAQATDIVNLELKERIYDNIYDLVGKKRHIFGKTKDVSVGILGMAYKSGVHITDESLGIYLERKLIKHHISTKTHDPMAEHTDNLEDVVKCDIVVIACLWRDYENLEFPEDTLVIDPSNFVKIREKIHVATT